MRYTRRLLALKWRDVLLLPGCWEDSSLGAAPSLSTSGTCSPNHHEKERALESASRRRAHGRHGSVPRFYLRLRVTRQRGVALRAPSCSARDGSPREPLLTPPSLPPPVLGGLNRKLTSIGKLQRFSFLSNVLGAPLVWDGGRRNPVALPCGPCTRHPAGAPAAGRAGDGRSAPPAPLPSPPVQESAQNGHRNMETTSVSTEG